MSIRGEILNDHRKEIETMPQDLEEDGDDSNTNDNKDNPSTAKEELEPLPPTRRRP